jgi:uncharacterized protein (DUF362 family)
MGWTVNRRNFLYAMAILGSAFTAGFGSVGALLKGTSGKREPIIRDNRYTSHGKSLVSVVGGGDVKRMVSEAVTLLGGFEKIDVKGKTVLVKPNVVDGKKNPTTTNPEVVRAVVELLFEAGAAVVWVGDMSALMKLSTKSNMEKTGIKLAAEKAGARAVYFEDHEWYEVPLAGGKYIKSVGVSEWIYNADRIVNLPVIKTHRSASYSPYFVDSEHWEEVVTEINLAYTPDLNIADGTVTMVEGGPWSGKVVATNLILASGDRVAADVVGLGIIKAFGLWRDVTQKGVWEQRQIRRALDLGMGRGEIELLTTSLDKNEEFLKLMRAARENISQPD